MFVLLTGQLAAAAAAVWYAARFIFPAIFELGAASEKTSGDT